MAPASRPLAMTIAAPEAVAMRAAFQFRDHPAYAPGTPGSSASSPEVRRDLPDLREHLGLQGQSWDRP